MTETQKRKRQKKGDAHYVNNREFTLALDDYSRAYRKAMDEEKEPPQMSNYLGECIVKMSNRLASTPRFSGYSFKDEMIQNGIMGAFRFAWRFNGDKYDNGFAYITQIIFSQFVLTIKGEKKKYETKLNLVRQLEFENISSEEFKISEEFTKEIADQKLKEIENSKEKKGRGGFQLRTGYTKESREAYTGGTPLVRD